VAGDHHIRQIPQWRVRRQRLVLDDVQPSPGNPSLTQSPDQRSFIDDVAPAHVEIEGKPAQFATPNALVKLTVEHDRMFTH
jgi:hypothetical protein